MLRCQKRRNGLVATFLRKWTTFSSQPVNRQVHGSLHIYFYRTQTMFVQQSKKRINYRQGLQQAVKQLLFSATYPQYV